jgi:hypothetical protein
MCFRNVVYCSTPADNLQRENFPDCGQNRAVFAGNTGRFAQAVGPIWGENPKRSPRQTFDESLSGEEKALRGADT